MKTLVRLALLALLGLLGVACSACAPLTTDGVSVDDLATYAGVAFCREPREVSFAFVRTGLAPTEDAAVRAHEERHKAQYRRWVSCAAFDAYYATDSGYVQIEGEASAVQFCVMVASGVDSTEARADMVERIARQGRTKRHGTSAWDAAQALDRFLADAHGVGRACDRLGRQGQTWPPLLSSDEAIPREAIPHEVVAGATR